MTNPQLRLADSVILELKFTNRFPEWFRELVKLFGIMQGGIGKYYDAVASIDR
jgi:hypothetical protein